MLLSIFLTLCLTVALSVSFVKGETSYFIQITDIHFDKDYKAGTDPDLRCTHGTGDAGSMAHLGCDLSPQALKGMYAKVLEKYPNPEFILYTGDASPHYVLPEYAQMYTEDMVLGNVRDGLKDIADVFTGFKIFPVMGNHDAFPSDELNADEEGMKYIQKIGEIFTPYIQPKSVLSFNQGGYYAEELDEHTRVIVVTTLWCNALNFYALFSGAENTCGMFDWMRSQLDLTRAMGKKAIIGIHRPPGYAMYNAYLPQMMPSCEDEFKSILDEYKDVATYGAFAGHTHANENRIIFGIADGQPVNVVRVAAATSTYSKQQPGIVVWFRDPEAGLIVDSESLYMDIEKSNAANEVILDSVGSFAEYMELPDLSAQSIYDMAERMTAGWQDPYYLKWYGYTRNYAAEVEEPSEKMWAGIVCSIYIGYADFDTCYKSLIPSTPE